MNITPAPSDGKVIQAATYAAMVGELEKEHLQQPQLDAPIVHRFGPGIYIREITLPANSWAIGHHHKTTHVCILLRGHLTVAKEDGTSIDLVGPLTFVAPPGRKVVYAHDECIFQNVHATHETDLEILEDMFHEKSLNWQEARPLQIACDADITDYHAFLAEWGVSEDEARAITENAADQIPFPYGSYAVGVYQSPIQGRGLFATAPFDEGDVICPALLDDQRTPAGRYTNHSATPNARPVLAGNGDIYFQATRAIAGQRGGALGAEITIDYRAATMLRHQGELK